MSSTAARAASTSNTSSSNPQNGSNNNNGAHNQIQQHPLDQHDVGFQSVLIEGATSPIPHGTSRDGVLAHVVLFMLEIVDFLVHAMEPFFR